MGIHLKTAWNNIRRSPFQALAAVFILAVTFFVTTILSVFIYSSNQVLGYFETRPQVIAFLKDDAKQEDITTLQNKLASDTRLKKVNYVSKEQALEIYKKATKDNPLLTELVSPSIFPASLEFSLSNLAYADDVIAELKKESIVDEVGFTASLGGESSLTDVVARLRQISNYIRIGGGVFIGFLLGTSLMVMFVIISMRMTGKRGEIEILDLIGATPGFIRSPIVLESLIYGLVGSFVGWVSAVLLILYSTPSLIHYFGEIPVLPDNTLNFLVILLIILAVEIVAGVSLSLGGSLLAVSRVKRKK
jgi:cell division transport system permease protein